MKTVRTLALAGLALAASLLATPQAEAQWGSIKGKVVLDGAVPELNPLTRAGDNSVKDAAVCAAKSVPDESAVIDPTTKGIANVAIYLRKKPSKIAPALEKPANPVVLYDQKNCQFIPHVTVVQSGQQVQVINSDGVSHNTRGAPLKNQGFNILISANDQMGVKIPLKLAESVPVGIGCDIHPWMKGWWLIVDHPYAAITAADGSFEIKDLPEGEHEFRVWQERVGYIEKSLTVNVKNGAVTEVPTIKVPVATLMSSK